VPFNGGDRVAIMVNGLGGTPITELYVIYAKAHELAQKAGFKVVRNYVGEYCTSLEMAGASLTILRLDAELEALLDARPRPPRASLIGSHQADTEAPGSSRSRRFSFEYPKGTCCKYATLVTYFAIAQFVRRTIYPSAGLPSEASINRGKAHAHFASAFLSAIAAVSISGALFSVVLI
jgi:hypothetical protein